MEINSAEKNSQPLSAGLYQEIQKDILSGVFESGSKLTEAAVCKRYSVSRTPVREAFRQLEADGLIENIPNRGAFVTGLTKRDISDLFDLRSLFEIQAVEWAIKRMDDDDIDVLRETVEFMEFYTLKDDIEKVLSFNSQFHNTIYAGTKDRMIQRTDISEALCTGKDIYRRISQDYPRGAQGYIRSFREQKCCSRPQGYGVSHGAVQAAPYSKLLLNFI